MSRRIEQRSTVDAHIGHFGDHQRLQLQVQVCDPATGRSDGKPSQEPWPDELVVVITPADDEGWDRFAEVDPIKIPLAQLRAALASPRSCGERAGFSEADNLSDAPD